MENADLARRSFKTMVGLVLTGWMTRRQASPAVAGACDSVGVITLELAARFTAVAIAHAAESGALVSAAVVDGGGHLVHFQRMDGAEIAGPTLAVDKAFTAVAHRIATAELTDLAAPGGPLAGLAANGGGRYVVFGGGVPCWGGGRVVAGIGVSGGTVEQDVSCARAALAVWEAYPDGAR